MGVWIKLDPLQYRRSCLSGRKRTKTLLPRMPFFERLWGTIVALLTHRNNKKTDKRAESAICRFDDRQATFAIHHQTACWNTERLKIPLSLLRRELSTTGPAHHLRHRQNLKSSITGKVVPVKQKT